MCCSSWVCRVVLGVKRACACVCGVSSYPTVSGVCICIADAVCVFDSDRVCVWPCICALLCLCVLNQVGV